MATGSLYIVATPIGNLGDMTYRAVEVLRTVDLIAAEDTRHSQRLLNHYGVHTKTISFHDFSATQRLETLVDHLRQGKQVALISDAGTPLISDPGYELVYRLHQLKINVIPIPGPCAAIAALSASGLPTDRFIFEGFLPFKQQARRNRLQALVAEPRTIIFYESVHRIQSFFMLLIEIFGEERMAVLARELTKKFETIAQDNLLNLYQRLKSDADQQKGEFVILLRGKEKTKKDDEKINEYKRLLAILLEDLPLKQAVMLAMRLTNGKRSTIYSLALSMKKQ